MKKPNLKKIKLKKPDLKQGIQHVKKLRNPIKNVKAYRTNRTNVTAKAVVPFITNETVAEHREEVLKGARKYIYPLQHSKHKIVVISSSIFATMVVGLFAYGAVSLYKLQSTSTFVYRITQVVPFPVARVHGNMVSYESYLFELRHYMHYYETQQKLSFQTKEGKQQLQAYKQRALQTVIDDAYVKQLAEKNKVSVTNREVDQEIAIVKAQNRLGTSDQVFEDVLRDFWGWSLNDFKRSLRQQLLARKVVSKLDTAAHTKATAALAELNSGAVFGDVAKKYSNDTAANGDYASLIDRSNRDVDARVTAALFALKPGQTSGIIDTGYSLEIVKLTGIEGGKAHASHIQINLKNLKDFLDPIKAKQKAHRYIKV
ncbi:MAG: Peptidylprolyl isomerase [Candidatus Saccharibacteria bacterium]|nr:Peptidylprolyl isomerase [Candidatus Saccharibacteria bacterium]